jgi:hypothetical protein
LTYEKYIQVTAAMFQPVVRVTINSIPDGATVDVGGIPIGKTKIEKPLESGKMYTFAFRRQGYKPATRSYFVLPEQPEQTFTEAMLPVP